MTAADDTAALRAGLTDQIRDMLVSPIWQAAFQHVPRHLFAPRFAIHDPDTNSFTHHDTADIDPARRAAALAAAYTDDTLITQFDAGVPVSSSTEPSLMAAMLEALDAQPGHRVLEIGAGTGYNAALVCHALGEQHVSTIDVDGRCVDAARTTLAAAGYRPTLVCGDGAAGLADRAPFDRIIATCGVDRVPTAWIDQLAEYGAILVNVSKGIVLLHHTGPGTVCGRFHSSAGFMPLRSADYTARWSNQHVLEVTSGTADHVHTTPAPPALEFTTAAFLTSLVADRSQLVFVDSDRGTVASYRWAHPATRSWVRVDLAGSDATVHQSGPRQLWTELAPHLDTWQHTGHPGIDRYGLTVQRDGTHTLWLDEPERTVHVLPAGGVPE
ncbi:MAG: methyltransferase domain-containing protein [Actinophytocola sp.]|uniref:methyltransferase domain-containing protein n=1 Tax=Actinophytocola sp. TaxID=1872138 RepID=UPI001321AB2E|nr:methyltransferase domain-containing protein [Actinophytocola sp.]MPZ84697.1 methyltransferase domain-containing protein [Actinophytocola sp.]